MAFVSEAIGHQGSGTAGRRREAPGALLARYQPRLSGLLVAGAYLGLGWMLLRGWQARADFPLSAESGLGYALGILGGTLMLLLLTYPLRKRVRALQRLGSVSHWFRVHMLFGVLGPVCILFHCGFQLGSLNSNVALLCMVLVAASGLIGRYLYSRIHFGLYGERATLAQVAADVRELGVALHAQFADSAGALAALERWEQRVDAVPRSFAGSLVQTMVVAPQTWVGYLVLRQRLRRVLRAQPGLRHDPALASQLLGQLRAYFASVRKMTGLRLFERLFALWHTVHLPLFLMLVVSGIAHVVAVHMY